VAPEAWSWAALGGQGVVAARRAQALSDEGDDPGLTDRVGPPISKKEVTAKTKKRSSDGRNGQAEQATSVEGVNQKGKTYFPRRRDRRAGWMGRPG
jgi:hypothetical protein